jgi:hypothetical protein
MERILLLVLFHQKLKPLLLRCFHLALKWTTQIFQPRLPHSITIATIRESKMLTTKREKSMNLESSMVDLHLPTLVTHLSKVLLEQFKEFLLLYQEVSPSICHLLLRDQLLTEIVERAFLLVDLPTDKHCLLQALQQMLGTQDKLNMTSLIASLRVLLSKCNLINLLNSYGQALEMLLSV